MREKQGDSGVLYPLGVTPVDGGVKILAKAEGKTCSLLLYRHGEKEPCEKIPFTEEERTGNVWAMTLSGRDLENLEYCFDADGQQFADPYARELSGREGWGDFAHVSQPVRCRFAAAGFDWEGDRPLEIPYSETVLYRLHVRGFTKHSSSGAAARGTFAAVAEKIPYLKELGVTAVELMPPAEFEEVMMPEQIEGNPYGKEEPTGVLNYWGYAPANLLAPKAAYSAGESPAAEFKTMIKSLHKNGIECVVELFFSGCEPPRLVLDAARFWVQEYHVDGIHVSGFAPVEILADDPFLAGTKLIAAGWKDAGSRAGRGQNRHSSNSAWDEAAVTVRDKHLAVYDDKFQNDMRCFLKGDEDKLNSAAYHIRNNPAGYAVINRMDDTNGFTMMDMVSYDRKHNEKNGEGNQDGNPYNYSWNCGAEGPSRKKKITGLRKKQLRNAFLLLFLSQGTPFFLAGDEFGNSQAGNNNAYCQDNDISWLNWNLLKTNADLYEFVRHAIAFRKAHPAFHMEREPRLMDYKSFGRPDVSYHGENAWKPEFETYSRQLGILYWGPYAARKDGSEDDTFYVAYNMHWEPHVFGLPHLPKDRLWHVSFDTSKEEDNGYYEDGAEPAVKNQNEAVIPPRSIVVFRGKKGDGYYTYDTPVGDITICCKDNAVAGVHFGRTVPKDKELKETRTGLTDKVYGQLMEYFGGKRRKFDLPLAPAGTEFQKKVWDALRTIPYGETRSYKEIAAQLGDGNASRAVGMANNKNPIAIIVPCHRVVGADGSMVGYAGGLSIKAKLLELEKKNPEAEEGAKPGKLFSCNLGSDVL